MQREITYTNPFRISFNLYPYEVVDYKKSAEKILKEFRRKYEHKIKKALMWAGLDFVRMEWYSPKYYNFEGDSIDLVVRVADRELLRKHLQENSARIQNALDKNKSYDGYIALTVKSVEMELARLESEEYRPDTIVVRDVLTHIPFEEFKIQDYLVY
jgi:hypothetical protein